MVPIWTFCVHAPPKSFDGTGNGPWGVDKVGNVVGDAGRAWVVYANGMLVSVQADLFQLACSCCCEGKDFEHYYCLWSHVDAMGRVFSGYGMVAFENVLLLPCFPPVHEVLTGLLDPGLEHFPPLSHQSFVWQTL